MSTTKTEPTTVSLAGWKKAKTHNVLLPSNVRVEIQIPDLAAIIESGDLPQHLLDVALGVANEGTDIAPTPELIKQQREFTEHLVLKTVVNPKLTADDVKDLPYEDLEMLVQIATRQRDFDAEYKQIAGLSSSKSWRKFRGFDDSDSDLEG